MGSLQATSDVLTIADLARLLQISVRTVEALIKDGKAPPHIRIGRQRRWRRTDVLQWLDDQRQVTGSPRPGSDKLDRSEKGGAS